MYTDCEFEEIVNKISTEKCFDVYSTDLNNKELAKMYIDNKEILYDFLKNNKRGKYEI